MARKVNIAEAKAKLSELADAAHHGEEIIIARNGKPFARLAPLDVAPRSPRRFGKYEAQSKHVDWDKWWKNWKTLDRETEAAFDASPLFPAAEEADRVGARTPGPRLPRSQKPARKSAAQRGGKRQR